MNTKTLDFNFQVKTLKDSGEFEGYGAIFGNVDSYRDVILPGAFTETLKQWSEKGRFPSMLWQHDVREPVGVYTEMKEDETGLFVKGKITTGATRGRDAYEHMKAGSVDGLSIGYSVEDEDWNKERGVNLLKQIKLYEVSLVTMPANDEARISDVKAMIQAGEVPTERDFERFLREVGGFSKNQARGLVATGYKALNAQDRRDADAEEEAIKAAIAANIIRLKGK